MKTIAIKANQRKKIISKFSNSMTTSYSFSADSPQNQKISGQVEIKGSNWIFSKPATFQPLEADNLVSKGMWDTFYKVYVTPEHDVQITLKASALNRPLLYFAACLAVVAIATGLMLVGLK